MTKNVFVLGLDDFNRVELERIPGAEEIRYHELLPKDRLVDAPHIDFDALLDEARRQLAAFNGSVDAIVSYWDFPSVVLAAVLRQDLGLPGAPVTAVMACEHKYWQRVAQRAVLGTGPAFDWLDPSDPPPLDSLAVRPPFWLKGNVSYTSEAAVRVESADDLAAAFEAVREPLERLGPAFTAAMRYADVPERVQAVTGEMCVAEEELRGELCTIEGYAYRGEVRVYGVVDSIRDQGIEFARFQYPSRTPPRVQQRMESIARRFLAGVGYDDQAFNIEFFYDEDDDALHLLEVNTRHSQSHADLFYAVNGVPNHEVMVSLALGQAPTLSAREHGEYDCAAKFFLRRHEPLRVDAVPPAEEVAAIERDVPGSRIFVDAHEGDVLPERPGQHRYTLAAIYVGGHSERELFDKFESCSQALHFELSPA